MDKTVAVLGHPLAAEENRLAFAGWQNLSPRLIAPQSWPVRSLGVTYALPPSPTGGPASPIALPCFWAGRNSFFLWRGLGRTLSALRPSLLYCWEEPWCLSAWQACRWADRHSVPFVFYSAENRPKALPPLFRSLLRYVFARARACVVPTDAIAENIARLGFRGPALRVPLWLAPRKPLQPDYAGRRVAFVGRLIALKRVDLLIEAMALLPEFRLRVIGDGPERAPLQALAERLGVSSRVEFAGYVPNAGLEKALEGCGCVALPTASTPEQAEQFGKAVLEAVLCGLPALVTDSGQLPIWAQTLGTVRRIGEWTPASAAEAIADLWNRPCGDGVRLAARDAVWENYGADAIGRRMETAFADLLGGPR